MVSHTHQSRHQLIQEKQDPVPLGRSPKTTTIPPLTNNNGVPNTTGTPGALTSTAVTTVTTTSTTTTTTTASMNKKRGWRAFFNRIPVIALRLTKVPRVHPTLRVPRLPGGFVHLIKPGVKYEKVSLLGIWADDTNFQCIPPVDNIIVLELFLLNRI